MPPRLVGSLGDVFHSALYGSWSCLDGQGNIREAILGGCGWVGGVGGWVVGLGWLVGWLVGEMPSCLIYSKLDSIYVPTDLDTLGIQPP